MNLTEFITLLEGVVFNNSDFAHLPSLTSMPESVEFNNVGFDPNADELPLATALDAAFGSYVERFKSFFQGEAA